MEKEIVVLGISYDKPEKLLKFKKKHNLPFTFLSDRKKKVAKLYQSGNFLFANRNTYVIDKEGRIEKIYDKVNVNTHAAEILKYFENDDK
ncbi:MAG: peroxiredoxin [Candidatus Marinimicrobia bacterium]|nr:peroxiredoxin [Candidatus Neomarinimicrobiota bacterium]MBT3618229.1 peroxiredoxin [Candidatus Neomarinimicrobiota bacterium]MBT3829555.1 peroxiredoxin [Candidatus Neomarinimicrobiota bacterium]MBT3997438.1 peroxiredoxin [Candidatus Neomarinimicrobiota bacterium]MBT4281628.1 peroxiredoxin [Candidatus Neomarinimicrobiota bacterium]